MGVAANETNRVEQTTSRKAAGSPGDAPRVAYEPHPRTISTSEMQTLANIYAFVLECYEQKQIATKVAADTNTTRVERTDVSDEVHLAKEGGGQYA